MKDIRIHNVDSDITMFADDIIANKKNIIGLKDGRLVFIINSSNAVILEQYSDSTYINLGIESRCSA